ncbi:hypothetical protein FB451DRAFT_1191601 [Mycena latifolia]|nr:hypothetical protein FB451DRAFT_1191601 [Mycena latifolia]
MVLGFFRHIAHQSVQYFLTPTPPLFTPPEQVHQSHTSSTALPLLPIFDTGGNIMGYVRNDVYGPRAHAPALAGSVRSGLQPVFAPPPLPAAASLANQASQLYVRTSDGRFVPHQATPAALEPYAPHSRNLPPSIPLPGHEQTTAPPGDPIAHRADAPTTVEDEWDRWPSGVFQKDFTWQQFKNLKQLSVHWSCRVVGGDRKGDEMAGHWEAGKRSTRICQGHIACDVDTCPVIVRPQTTSEGIACQKLQRCRCNGKLDHYRCDVQSTLHKWSGGVHYSNLGIHDHPKLTHILHVSPQEQAKFEEIVTAHPATRPLGLIVGVPGLHGPRESVADISSVYLNADRVRKERDKIKKGGAQGGDGFVAEFAEFSESHPDFVIFSQLGAVTVICLQTPFMASQLVKAEPITTGPVNGLVSDAAHGWWFVRTSLLIVSSVYCTELFCWVPAIFSYTNGASAAHYECHFYALLESIAHQAELRQVEVTDRLFAGIADFSEAERIGFRAAFIRFWTVRPNNTRTREQLEEAFEAIYRGCTQHFRAGITRVKRISGVVPPDQAEAFEFRVLALLDAPNSEEFQARAAAVIRDFPKTESWLGWWMRKPHAIMLFASERKMDPELWDSIPDSTNAEEAFHWKLYCAAGRLHALMEGFRALFAVAEYYHRLYTGTIVIFQAGVPIRYGQAEPWKVISQVIGRTKPGRAPEASSSKRGTNDGRPPDTSAELLGKSKGSKGTSKAGSKPKPPARLVGYPWSKNSCWLDSGLELLFSAITRDFPDFSFVFEDIDPACGIAPLFKVMNLRKTLPGSDRDPSNMLSLQRDGFRTHLKACKLIKATNDFDSIIAWLPGLFKHKNNASSRSAQSYFHSKIVTIRSCAGSADENIAKHIQISCVPFHKYVHILQAADAKKFKSHIKQWLQNEILVNKTPPLNLRVVGAIGTALIILILEVNTEAGNDWDFPPVIETNHIIYDIVGRGFYSRTKNHFIVRYCDADKSAVYTYDDLKEGGFAVRERGGKGAIKTHLCGLTIDSPPRGLRAQETFETSQMEAAQRIHGLRFLKTPMPTITLQCSGFQCVKDSDRYWMKNPYETRTEDYMHSGTDAVNDSTASPPLHPDNPTAPAVIDVSDTQSDDDDTSDKDNPSDNNTPDEQEFPAVEDLLRSDNESEADADDDHDMDDPPPEDLPLSPLRPELNVPDNEFPPEDDSDKDDPMPLSQTESEFPFSCRCGAQGPDGSVFVFEDPAIQCDRCREWSHISCQRDGRAYKNKSADPFECDYCSRGGILPDLRIAHLDDPDTEVLPVRQRASKRLHVLLYGDSCKPKTHRGPNWPRQRCFGQKREVCRKNPEWVVPPPKRIQAVSSLQFFCGLQHVSELH